EASPHEFAPASSWTYTHAHSVPGVALFIQIARRSYPDQFHGSGSSRSAPAHWLFWLIVTSSRMEPLPSFRIVVSWDRLLDACGFETTGVHRFAPKMLSIESKRRTGVVWPRRARACGSRDAVTAAVVPFV